jgi:hypothetical protein
LSLVIRLMPTYSKSSPSCKILSSSLSNFDKSLPVASSHVTSLTCACTSAGSDISTLSPYV